MIIFSASTANLKAEVSYKLVTASEDYSVKVINVIRALSKN